MNKRTIGIAAGIFVATCILLIVFMPKIRSGSYYSKANSYYDEGDDHDYAEAVKWYLKSAELGNAEAQNKLGDCYYNGYGVKKDYDA
ncbi:MAG: hypothetical protein LBC41_12090, partial [Clostridiales bacterium]|nr:hypothetical protein [Clostridiales bacterium]MDR2751392.1 hypothetical protein [Clostridiales bacterium]